MAYHFLSYWFYKTRIFFETAPVRIDQEGRMTRVGCGLNTTDCNDPTRKNAPQGCMFAIGRLLRQMRYLKGKVEAPFPKEDVHTLLVDCGRYYLGEPYGEQVAEGLLGLEKN
jgi:hypothetical protein